MYRMLTAPREQTGGSLVGSMAASSSVGSMDASSSVGIVVGSSTVGSVVPSPPHDSEIRKTY